MFPTLKISMLLSITTLSTSRKLESSLVLAMNCNALGEGLAYLYSASTSYILHANMGFVIAKLSDESLQASRYTCSHSLNAFREKYTEV
jgi:hypothetical protein